MKLRGDTSQSNEFRPWKTATPAHLHAGYYSPVRRYFSFLLFFVFLLYVIKPPKNRGPECKPSTSEGILYTRKPCLLVYGHYRQVSRVPGDELGCDQRLLLPV